MTRVNLATFKFADLLVKMAGFSSTLASVGQARVTDLKAAENNVQQLCPLRADALPMLATNIPVLQEAISGVAEGMEELNPQLAVSLAVSRITQNGIVPLSGKDGFATIFGDVVFDQEVKDYLEPKAEPQTNEEPKDE